MWLAEWNAHFWSECFRLNTCIGRGVGGNRTDPGREEQAGIVWLPQVGHPMVEEWVAAYRVSPRIPRPYHNTARLPLGLRSLIWEACLGLRGVPALQVCLRYDTPPPPLHWPLVRCQGLRKRGQLILQRGGPYMPPSLRWRGIWKPEVLQA